MSMFEVPQMSQEASGESDEGLENSFDQEKTERESMVEAMSLIKERGFDEMDSFEQVSSIINLMEELAEDNDNRHVVEALARMTSIIEADNKSHLKKEAYPEAAAALGR